MKHHRLMVWALVYSVLLIMVLYNVLPFLWMVSTSFKTEREAYAIPPTVLPKRPTLDAYEQILIWANFPRYYLNSIIISLGTALLSTLVGALGGYGFSRYMFRGRGFLMGLILASQMLPGVLLVGPYFKLLSQLGLYNTYPGIILAFTTITLPFSVWMLKGFADTVPRDIDEAALVDGCNRAQAFFYVILPLIAPGMVVTVTFAFLLAWGDLLWVLVLTSGEAMTTITLALSRLVTQFRIIWPQLMAGATIATLPPLIFYLWLQDYLVRGLTAGAVEK